uniref:hypothetical protein n=1 Tax=Streptomyces violascens TaxID=67381 RepID=UPI001671DF57
MDAASGAQRWSSPTGGSVRSSPTAAMERSTSAATPASCTRWTRYGVGEVPWEGCVLAEEGISLKGAVQASVNGRTDRLRA